MLANPSPRLAAQTLSGSSPLHRYDQPPKTAKQGESVRRYHTFPESRHPTLHKNASTKSLDRYKPPSKPAVKMVDKATQWSPPDPDRHLSPPPSSTKIPTSTIAGLRLNEDGDEGGQDDGGKEEQEDLGKPTVLPSSDTPGARDPVPIASPSIGQMQATSLPPQSKRQAMEPVDRTPPFENGVDSVDREGVHHSPVKRPRPDEPPIRLMPVLYENCNTRDLVILISSMLMELIRYNDAIPLRDGQLTRFHSRAPPGISVLEYLQRLTTHATLSPPILLSVVYYIDRLCALYPAFTISSLTVHRFLITSATVASKGLSDSFWTNKTYARVGGVSMKELALLELEFLTRMEWRIVPKPEVLTDYYRSLIERNLQYKLEES